MCENRVALTLMSVHWLIFVVELLFLPDVVPAHWSDSIEPDRWGSKYELLILPIMASILELTCMGCERLVRGEKYGQGKSSEALMHKTTIAICMLMIAIQLGVLALILINI